MMFHVLAVWAKGQMVNYFSCDFSEVCIVVYSSCQIPSISMSLIYALENISKWGSKPFRPNWLDLRIFRQVKICLKETL